jgi:hypothetical protein
MGTLHENTLLTLPFLGSLRVKGAGCLRAGSDFLDWFMLVLLLNMHNGLQVSGYHIEFANLFLDIIYPDVQ